MENGFERRQMNILWLSHLVPYPPKGGVLQRSFNLIKEISKYNNVHLLAFNQKALLQTNKDLKDAVRALEKYCVTIDIISLPADKIFFAKYLLAGWSFFTAKPYTVNWNLSAVMKRKVLSAVESFRPHVIHYDTIGMAEYFLKGIDVPQILNHHNIESHMMFRRTKLEKNPAKRIYFKREARKVQIYEKRMCELADCNLTVSPLDASKLKEIAPKAKVGVIPNGVDTNHFNSRGEIREKDTLIFAGGMNWYPNRDAMLFFAEKVWPLLKRKRKSARIFVIGQSPPRDLINRSLSDPDFVVTGFVDDVRPFFEEASVYVCPMRDGGGTRLKILDALSSGIPIVATKMAAEGIDVEHEKNILFAESPQEICASIIRLLENQHLREKLALEGRKLVEASYEWSIIGKRLSSIYRELAN